jgi:hypothetical protein
MKTHIEKLRDVTEALIERSAEQERFDKRKDILIDILTTLNFLESEEQSIETLLRIIKQYTGVEAIALRLQEGGDYPFFVIRGFPAEFSVVENSLCSRDAEFNLIINDNGEPALDCMCGCVITECAGPEYSFFSEGGSFYTGDAAGLIAGNYGPVPAGLKVRGTCVKFGYSTIAIIPLRGRDNKIVGVLQLNDKKMDAVSLETVRFFEGIGTSIGVALQRIQDWKRLKEECYGRPGEDNKLQSNSAAT